MSSTEELFLILLYNEVDFNHKSYYSKIQSIIGTYVRWYLGHAFITEDGIKWVEDNV